MSDPVVIEAKGLTKRYGRAVAVDGVDLAVGKGEVFGLLGPNGSGKTTTILMLLGLTEPTAGAVRVLGYDPFRQPLAVKRRVGYLPDSVGFYDHMSAAENLAYTARLAGIPSAEADTRIAGALQRVGLASSARRRTSTFSHGMRQRLGLAEVLVKQPAVAILDEPTNGLDPQATHELLGLIGELRRDGMTILLSSHLLGLVETICSRVALFNRGKVGLTGRVDDLARDVLGGSYVVEVEAENIDLPSALSGVTGIAAVVSLGGQHFRVDADRDLRPEIARLVVGRGGALRNMAIRRAGLDEVYVRYFQRAEAGSPTRWRRPMRREGSPFTGMSTIALKEAADHMTSARMHLVMLLVLLTAGGAIYAAIGQIKNTVGQDPFLFLRLFTTSQQPLPSFVAFLGFLLPLVAIALGFDGINGEYGRRTMSRVLAQPIYRDALLAGKFLGGLLVLAICLVTLWLLMTGLGILLLGLPPSGEEVLRGIGFLVASLAYSGVWLAAALLFSTVFRSPATSALAALTLWLLFAVFWSMLTPLIANAISPVDPFDASTAVANAYWADGISRISPSILYGQMMQGLLDPATRAFGVIFLTQLEGALMQAPLSFEQSALLIWPQLAGLVAGTVLLYTLAYVLFQRQEIRA